MEKAYKIRLTNSRLLPHFSTVTIMMQAGDINSVIKKYLTSLCINYKSFKEISNTDMTQTDIIVENMSDNNTITNWHVVV
jgi:hypothetical protein